jgi:hypothetical protein
MAGNAPQSRPVKALREGACDETPFEMSCFPFSIQNWHFVTKMARTSCLSAWSMFGMRAKTGHSDYRPER